MSTGTAASSIPFKFQAALMFFFALSISLINDESDSWSTDAKLKMKVGVVSVKVEQQRVGCKIVYRCWTLKWSCAT